MVETVYIFLLGASFMFSLMIAWLFYSIRRDTLSRLIIALMLVMAAGFIKDICTSGSSMMAVSVDIVAIPLYACILYELCNPGRIRVKAVFIVETPFIILPILLAITDSSFFYYADLALGIALGVTMFTWTCFAIPRYNRKLKASFSVDLRWLQSILWSFLGLLAIWGLSCIFYNPWLDIAYMCCASAMWCFVCYFLYKHKSVVEDLKPVKEIDSNGSPRDVLFSRIRNLIVNERIYLNPQLKLSDIARMANTNRSYASAFFNSQNTTFYDYINGLRIEYAKTLLADSSRRVEDIAFDSGYNSRQSFNRVFRAIEGISPSEFRTQAQPSVN